MIYISHITNYYPIKNDKNQNNKVPRLHKENEIRNKLGKLFYCSAIQIYIYMLRAVNGLTQSIDYT